jgi:hypothetical protein
MALDIGEEEVSEADPTLPYSNTSVTAVTPAPAKTRRVWLFALSIIGLLAVFAFALWQLVS